MLRLLLALLVLSAGALDAQPPTAAQPQVFHVEVPAPVRIENSPENNGWKLVHECAPALLGALAVIVGIFLTNRINQKTARQNRIDDQDKWFHERRYETKKDLLINLLRQISRTRAATVHWRTSYNPSEGGRDSEDIAKAKHELSLLLELTLACRLFFCGDFIDALNSVNALLGSPDNMMRENFEDDYKTKLLVLIEIGDTDLARG